MAIGIDLGTSNSCVAIARKGRVDVLANAQGELICPSVVHFATDGSVRIGHQAKALAIHDPEHTVTAAKRLMGRYYFSEEVKKAKAVATYRIVEGSNHSVRIQVREQALAIPEVSALVLREMKQVAEAQLGQPISQAVITVPAYFNDNQRQATRDAGKIAGLEVLRLLNEPTAAALAYGFGKGLAQRVAVYDLGGGTFDISILEIGSDVFEVLSTCGDTFLGGEDFDDRVIDWVADAFLGEHKINLRNDRFALEKLKAAAEQAKKQLSVDEEAQIRIPEVIQDATGAPLSVERTLGRREFGALVSDLIQRTFKVCDEALQQANLTVRDLDGVILVGGPTRLPIIREAVSQYFQREPKTEVDPDQVVAMGAAIHAAALVGEETDSTLLDVTPLSLRIGVAGGLAETVIERNTPVPIEQTSGFTTFRDYQQSVKIRVYQGESRVAAENEMLGEFEFSGFKNARRGEVRIEVTFEIDTDGIVNVTARDPDSGQAASTQIHLSSGLSEEELRDLVEKHKTEAETARPASPPPPPPSADAATETLATTPSAGPQDMLVPLGEGEIDLEAAADAAPLALGDEIELDPGEPAPLEVETAAQAPTAAPAADDLGDRTQMLAEITDGFDFEDPSAPITVDASPGDDGDLDPLDLDEADLDSLVEMAGQEIDAIVEVPEPAVTRPRVATREEGSRELFETPGGDLSRYGRDDEPGPAR